MNIYMLLQSNTICSILLIDRLHSFPDAFFFSITNINILSSQATILGKSPVLRLTQQERNYHQDKFFKVIH